MIKTKRLRYFRRKSNYSKGHIKSLNEPEKQFVIIVFYVIYGYVHKSIKCLAANLLTNLY